jgi:hypothetical protein
MLEEVSARLEIDTPDVLDLSLIDTFSFKSGDPGKWPSWTDLDIRPVSQGNSVNRGAVIKAVYDLCSKVDRMLGQKDVAPETRDLHRARMASLRKKLTLLEDAISPTDPSPLLAALEATDRKLKGVDPNNPEVSILDAFVFSSGKPGLFTTWTDLDITSDTAGSSSHRGAVVRALCDLVSKSDQMLARPVCQRTLGSTVLEKYRSMMMAISETVSLLGDILSPPALQPLLAMVEEVNRRFENGVSEALDVSVLDSFAFCPGKPGLFTVWTDLDITTGRTGSCNNRGAVIMAVDDLMVKFDRMLARPASQKALGMETVQKYRLMRNAVGEKLGLLKNAVVPTNPTVAQTPLPPTTVVVPLIASPPSLAPSPPLSSQEQGKIDAVKTRIGNQIPILTPTLFSRVAWMEAGAMAGSSMMVVILISIVFRSFVRAVPLVGILAIVVSFVRRHGLVAARAKRCAVARDLYKNAATNNDIVNVFPLLTKNAQAQFLVGLDSNFRESIARKYARLKNMCAYIDAFLSSPPESLERTHTLTSLRNERLGEEVVHALSKKEIN